MQASGLKLVLFGYPGPRLIKEDAAEREREVEEAIAFYRHAGFEIESVRYLTAPLDVVRPTLLARALRATLFRGASTALPVLSTSIFVRARRPRQPSGQ